MSEKTPALATTPHPLGRPGGPGLFHDKALQLPPYIQNIAHALMRERGMTKSRAIQIALGKVEDWKDGKGNVSAEVRAASAAAWAQWLAARATARAKPNKSDHANDTDAVELAQPRVPTGNTGAGQWYGDPCYPTSARTREVPTVNAGNLSSTTSSNTMAKATKTVSPGKGSVEDRLHRKLVARGIHPTVARKMAKRAAARVIREQITGPGTPAAAALSRSGGNVVELAEIHQWKHGWIPLTPFAAAIKAKMAHGSTRGHSPDLPKSLHGKAAELHSKHGKSVVHGSYGHSEIPAGHASRKVDAKAAEKTSRLRDKLTAAQAEHDAAQRAVDAIDSTPRAGMRRGIQHQRRVAADVHRTAEAFARRDRAAHEVKVLQQQIKSASAKPVDPADLKGARFVRDRYGWHEVDKVNAKTVSVKTGYSWTDRIPHDRIHEVRSHEPVAKSVEPKAAEKAVEVAPKKVTPESKRAAERKTLTKDERAAYNKAAAEAKDRGEPAQRQHQIGMATAKEHTAAKQRAADIAHYTPEQRKVYDRYTYGSPRAYHHEAMRHVAAVDKERAAAAEKKAAADARNAKPLEDFKANIGSMSDADLKKNIPNVAINENDRVRKQIAGAELQRRMSARTAERLTAKPEQVIGGAGLHRIHGAPHQYLVKQDGKALGIVTGHSKDKSGELKPTLIDDTPTHYVATTVGRRKPGSGTSTMPKKNSEHTSLADAVGAVQTRGAKIPKESKADQASLFDVPKAGRSTKAPAMGEGELGGPIKFEGGRTGTVWAEAPDNGKWVIPDERQPGEAHAIYVDKSGKVHAELSSAATQKRFMHQFRASTGTTNKQDRAAAAQTAKTPTAAAKTGPSEQKAPRPSDAPKPAAPSAPNEPDEPVRRITVSPATAKAAKAKDAAIDKVEAARANPSHWANVSDAELVSLLRAIDFGGRGPTTSQALADVWAEIHRRGLKVPANLSSTGGNVIELAKVPARLRAKARQKAADNDTALPDGSWPIRNRAELADAIQSWGRAVASGHAATVKAWMVKRAKALGASQDVIARIQALEAA